MFCTRGADRNGTDWGYNQIYLKDEVWLSGRVVLEMFVTKVLALTAAQTTIIAKGDFRIIHI